MEKDSIADMALNLFSVMGCPACGGARMKIQKAMGWTNLICLQCQRTVGCPPGEAVEIVVKIKIMGEDNCLDVAWHTAKIGTIAERLHNA